MCLMLPNLMLCQEVDARKARESYRDEVLGALPVARAGVHRQEVRGHEAAARDHGIAYLGRPSGLHGPAAAPPASGAASPDQAVQHCDHSRAVI